MLVSVTSSCTWSPRTSPTSTALARADQNTHAVTPALIATERPSLTARVRPRRALRHVRRDELLVAGVVPLAHDDDRPLRATKTLKGIDFFGSYRLAMREVVVDDHREAYP